MVELTWNVNQPGGLGEGWAKWPAFKEADTDWKRFIMNRPFEAVRSQKISWIQIVLAFFNRDARPMDESSNRYGSLVYRFETSKKCSGQWWHLLLEWRPQKLGHHNGSVWLWCWKFIDGFQVTFSSRMHNGDENPKEVYFSNGGELNMQTNKVSPTGGLALNHAQAMGLKKIYCPSSIWAQSLKVETAANTGGDYLTTATCVIGWSVCVANNPTRQSGWLRAFYCCIMTNAAVRTGTKVTFDEAKKSSPTESRLSFKYR